MSGAKHRLDFRRSLESGLRSNLVPRVSLLPAPRVFVPSREEEGRSVG